MKKVNDYITPIKESHSRTLRKYIEFIDYSKTIYKDLTSGVRGNELNQRLMSKNRVADELVELSRETERARKDYIAHNGDPEILRTLIDAFNHELNPLLAKIIVLENKTGDEMKRAGIKIVRHPEK
ncbi:MAG: hypothetical protein GF307_09290 [candidate division Zixibacteria bacterium]|nr:hypothetical protein [candidate division Zixibacteria bacterium]